MPRAVLNRHIPGMGGAGGVQLGIEADLPKTLGFAQGIQTVEEPELNLRFGTRFDLINLWQRLTVGAPWNFWCPTACGQNSCGAQE